MFWVSWFYILSFLEIPMLRTLELLSAQSASIMVTSIDVRSASSQIFSGRVLKMLQLWWDPYLSTQSALFTRISLRLELEMRDFRTSRIQ